MIQMDFYKIIKKSDEGYKVVNQVIECDLDMVLLNKQVGFHLH